MAEVYPRKLQLWDGWAPSVAPGPTAARTAPVPPRADAFAARLFAAEAMQPGRTPRGEGEPYSLQWFLEAEGVRYGRHGRWLPRLLEFGKHGGETLLGLGDGLGADWVQFARSGALVTACCASADVAAVVQRNFELRGLRGRFLTADPARLPLEPASIDVVCINNLLHVGPGPGRAGRRGLSRPKARRQGAGRDAGPP